MRYFSKILVILFLAVVIFSLTACGKVSNPSPLEGSGYPHSYPRY